MTTPTRRTRVRSGAAAASGRRPGANQPGASRPGASRPAPAPRSREAVAEEPTRTSARVRWAVLAAIAVVLLVALVPTVRSLARQRAEIAALQAKVAAQQVQVAELQAEQERWNDPAYVEQQARDRLKFVKVGDRSYTVIDPADAARPAVSGASVAAPEANADVPWYGQVWQSVQLADRPTAGLQQAPAPPPATAPAATPTPTSP